MDMQKGWTRCAKLLATLHFETLLNKHLNLRFVPVYCHSRCSRPCAGGQQFITTLYPLQLLACRLEILDPKIGGLQESLQTEHQSKILVREPCLYDSAFPLGFSWYLEVKQVWHARELCAVLVPLANLPENSFVG